MTEKPGFLEKLAKTITRKSPDKKTSPPEAPRVPERERGAELQRGIVWVYRIVPKESVPGILQEGITVSPQPPERTKDPSILRAEEIFLEATAGKELMGRTRLNSTFAFPVDPRQNEVGLSVNPEKDAVVKIAHSLWKAVVADGELFTEAVERIRMGDEAGARSFAEKYWNESLTLLKYLSKKQKGDPDFFDFNMPEVLLPDGILPEYVETA